MAEETQTPETLDDAVLPDLGAEGSRPPRQSPLEVQPEVDPYEEQPHLFAGAAFAGGFVLAKLLKRLRGGG